MGKGSLSKSQPLPIQGQDSSGVPGESAIGTDPHQHETARMRIPAGDLSSSSSWLRVVAVEVEILRRIPSDGEGTQGHLSWGSGRNPLLDFCTSEAALDGAP